MSHRQGSRTRALVLILLLLPGAVRASDEEEQDPTPYITESLGGLQEISVASKRPQSIEEAPAVISVIPRDDILRLGARNLHDLLIRLPNVYTLGASSSVARNNATVIRGQTSSLLDNHVAVLINGRPARDSHSGGWNSALYRSFPVDAIERVEVSRGPGSNLYGTNAFSVVNIVTRSPEPTLGPGGETEEYPQSVSVTAGELGTEVLDLSLGTSGSDHHLLLAGTARSSDGWRFAATDFLGVTAAPRFEESDTGVVLTAGFKGFSLMGFSGRTDSQKIGAPPLFPGEGIRRDRDFLDLGWSGEVGRSYDLSVNLTYNGYQTVEPLLPATPRGPGDDWSDLLLEAQVRGSLGAAGSLNFVAGTVVEDRHGDFAGGGEYDEEVVSAYGQVDYRLSRHTTLIGGLQLNDPENSSTHLSPRLGAIFQLNRRMGLKLLYGEAFRSPFGSEQAVDLPLVTGNPDLEPETLETAEVQLFYSDQGDGGWGRYLALTLYRSRQEDTITLVPGSDGRLTFANLGELEYRGLELEGRYPLGPALEIQGSLSVQETEDAGGREAGLVGDFSAKLGLGYHTGSLTAGLVASYFDDAARLEERTEVAVVNPPAEGFLLLTGNLRARLSSWLDWSRRPDLFLELYGDNLLDEEVFFPEHTFQLLNTLPERAGRTLYFTVGLEF